MLTYEAHDRAPGLSFGGGCPREIVRDVALWAQRRPAVPKFLAVCRDDPSRFLLIAREEISPVPGAAVPEHAVVSVFSGVLREDTPVRGGPPVVFAVFDWFGWAWPVQVVKCSQAFAPNILRGAPVSA